MVINPLHVITNRTMTSMQLVFKTWEVQAKPSILNLVMKITIITTVVTLQAAALTNSAVVMVMITIISQTKLMSMINHITNNLTSETSNMIILIASKKIA